jgi:hypothetical protein
MRRQNAVYWPPSGFDDFGQRTYGTLVELTKSEGTNNCVRWEDRNDEFVDMDGTMVISSSVVYCPALSDGDEMVVGGFLWLGDRVDLADESIPSNNIGAAEIRRFDKMPNLKTTEFLRTAYLRAN